MYASTTTLALSFGGSNLLITRFFLTEQQRKEQEQVLGCLMLKSDAKRMKYNVLLLWED